AGSDASCVAPGIKDGGAGTDGAAIHRAPGSDDKRDERIVRERHAQVTVWRRLIPLREGAPVDEAMGATEMSWSGMNMAGAG
ncbi:MAG: hypothetical protein AAFU59_16290, partial [Pseudomonadota bacterium]